MLLNRLQLLILVFLTFGQARQSDTDLFEQTGRWTVITSEQVEVQTHAVQGLNRSALQMDIHFLAGSGYGGVQIKQPMMLPENFQFSFYVKGDLPVNNLEFKLIDASGENVWWCNKRSFEFPARWQKLVIKKRDIEFAWGPAEDRTLGQIAAIEIIIASVKGGKGSLYLDELRFEVLDVPDPHTPQPLFRASSLFSVQHPIEHIGDGNLSTLWRNAGEDSIPQIIIDLQKYREFGGLVIDWDEQDYAREYQIYTSSDQANWNLAYHVQKGAGGRRYIYLKDFDARYIRMRLLKSSRNRGYAIRELEIRDYEFSRNKENFFKAIAGDQDRGLYPRYFYDEQIYWTLAGGADDLHEGLLDEDGRIEADIRGFSVEPFIYLNGRLFTWNDVRSSQHLDSAYLPIPSVVWHGDDFKLEIKAFADQRARGSVLFILYTLINQSKSEIGGNCYLALRPFQVNPPWQFLNNPGGVARIESIQREGDFLLVNGHRKVFFSPGRAEFGASAFDSGEISEYLVNDSLPAHGAVSDPFAAASGALRYPFRLKPKQAQKMILALPWESGMEDIRMDAGSVMTRLSHNRTFWQQMLNHINLELPARAQRIVNTIRSNLAYILINRDGAGIQPGSRSYERSWIRDGSLTSAALLRMGLQKEAREFIEWYAGYQYENGKVPCVVDVRGPDPVPENDSHGQLIFAIRQYYLFTRDRDFLQRHFDHVRRAIEYMEFLTGQRRTDQYKYGSEIDRACYGLLPESISHEGYSAKPMHSYWDDFFALRGYRDAVEIARILGEDSIAEKWSQYSARFAKHLRQSVNQAMSIAGIDYVPGCVELGDFDATSTAIAFFPCNVWRDLPSDALNNTFDRYFDYFRQRRDADFKWIDYTPYEVRLIGTFNYLGQRERAHELIEFFFQDQRPAEWNHWAEVVRQGYRTPGFIGDMPHTWVGSDFINAARSLFVYEDETEQALVIAAGIPDTWLEDPAGVKVTDLPTYFGKLSYSIKKQEDTYHIRLNGNLQIPEGNIKIPNFKKSNIRELIINGRMVKEAIMDWIHIREIPADIVMRY